MIYTYKKLKKQSSVPKSLGRVSIAVFVIFLGISLTYIGGTNAVFTDRSEIEGMTFTAGVWIPTLTMTISPEASNGKYEESPCVKIYSDIDDVTIYYSFDTGEDIIGGIVDEDVCVFPPEGESNLMAYGVNDKNDNWKSEKIYESFFVQPEVESGSVLINELMWMGSFGNDDDEWIELRNMTDDDIDLSGWRIKGAGKGSGGHIQIPHGYSIEANGYFLITAEKWNKTKVNLTSDFDKDEGYTHVASMGLKNSGERLVLEDKGKNTIDTAWKDKKWPDGWNGKFFHLSMERDDDPGDGTKSSDWHTCVDEVCNDETYWRKEKFNFGTPGAKNSSKSKLFDIDHDTFEKDFIEKMKGSHSLFDDIWSKYFDDKKECDKKECKKGGEEKNEKNDDAEDEEVIEGSNEEADVGDDADEDESEENTDDETAEESSDDEEVTDEDDKLGGDDSVVDENEGDEDGTGEDDEKDSEDADEKREQYESDTPEDAESDKSKENEELSDVV